jgi:predicted phage tail protein
LTWADNSSNVTSFNIERSTDGVNFGEITAVGANVTSYSNTGLSSSTTYYYRVRASNAAGNSAYSNIANATTQGVSPNAPSGLVATAISKTRIDLAWTDNSNNETGFKIERSTNGTTFSQIATVGVNVTTYSNNGLKGNKTYWYRVRAYNGTGNSGYSNVASATTPRK